jgi:hypothetical protein
MIYLVNGIADKHARAAEKQIARILAAKMDTTIKPDG